MKVAPHFHSEYFEHVFDLGREAVVLGLVDAHEDLFDVAVATRPVVRKRDAVHFALFREKLNKLPIYLLFSKIV